MRYSSATVVLLSEVLKLAVSLLTLLSEFRTCVIFFSSGEAWANSWALFVPAVIYTVQNTLPFVAMTYISAAEYQLLCNIKILTTAVFSILFLGTRLSRVQWLALALLVIGVALAQLDGHSNTKHAFNSSYHVKNDKRLKG